MVSSYILCNISNVLLCIQQWLCVVCISCAQSSCSSQSVVYPLFPSTPPLSSVVPPVSIYISYIYSNQTSIENRSSPSVCLETSVAQSVMAWPSDVVLLYIYDSIYMYVSISSDGWDSRRSVKISMQFNPRRIYSIVPPYPLYFPMQSSQSVRWSNHIELVIISDPLESSYLSIPLVFLSTYAYSISFVAPFMSSFLFHSTSNTICSFLILI